MSKNSKKLIEVALPLDAINKASAKEKSIRHGHPSTLHLWWARRPLAAARAVIFAQMVDDPSSHPDIFRSEKAQEKERQRLFRIIDDLVLWENTTNEKVLQQARDEIWQSWRAACAENADHPRAKELFDRHKLPGFHDPFAGGGALPLEAQRLGLEAFASDLNPVAVLINKAMIEIPPKFAGKPPVNPEALGEKELVAREWRGAQGLAEDVRHYGRWMRNEAEKKIGHLYPKIEITQEVVIERPDLKPLLGRKLTVIAWLWARTVKSPNPAFRTVDVPLVSTFMLSTKAGKEVYVEPVIEGGGYRFTVKVGKPKDAETAKCGTTAGKRSAFLCLMSGTPMEYDHIRSEGKAGRMGARLMAIVADGERGRVYLPPTEKMEEVARSAMPEWRPDNALPVNPRDFKTPNYGLTTFSDLFTLRQLVALTTFTDLVQEARGKVKQDAVAAGLTGLPSGTKAKEDDTRSLGAGGTGATAYADAVAVYMALAVDRMANTLCTIARWTAERQQTVTAFARQAIPMTWDYPEVNPFAGAAGDYTVSVEGVIKGIPDTNGQPGHAYQLDASNQEISEGKLVSTDPPYYDNIGYADLSDFFYIWLRRSLRVVFPDLFATLAVPKAEELVATPYRHGSKEKAEAFFLDGMTQAMQRLADQAHPAFPVTIYYAFKQAETEGDGEGGTASTGWDTFLDAVIRAGFAISGTWPMRTELSNRMIGSGTNALASSIVLVCHKRATDAPTATRRDFVATLKSELPIALAHLQRGNIAPVDLAQAAIGPGMAVYTRFSKVLDAAGKPLSVREALALINQTLDEVLAEQEGDFDADTRWALAWFGDHGFEEGPFGDAHTYFLRFNTAENALRSTGIIESGRGKVRLFKPAELPEDWDPATDSRLTVWEMVHHLIRVLEGGGEAAAAALAAKLGAKAEVARELAYRLYTVSERKKRAQEALTYNGLVQSWPEITRLAREGEEPRLQQSDLFNQE
jgi:putative DNA methylase